MLFPSIPLELLFLLWIWNLLWRLLIRWIAMKMWLLSLKQSFLSHQTSPMPFHLGNVFPHEISLMVFLDQEVLEVKNMRKDKSHGLPFFIWILLGSTICIHESFQPHYASSRQDPKMGWDLERQ